MNRTFSSSHDRVLAQRHADGWMFLLEALRDMRLTGSLAPSGQSLAEALAAPLRGDRTAPRTILEVGAGTGAVTRSLVRFLEPDDALHLVESNPRFADRLRRALREDPRLAPHADRVRVLEQPVERLSAHRRYDVIVSGLPFANFTPEQVKAILAVYWSALKPGGELTYFAYRGGRTLHSAVLSPPAAARHRAVLRVLRSAQLRYGVCERTVWNHFPPARVHRLRIPGLTTPQGGSRALVH